MRISRLLAIGCLSMLVVVMIISACKHGCGGEGKTSKYHKDDSHNMGLNCMNCHSGTGSGEGCFAVAGTVYGNNRKTELPNVTIKLYTAADGGGSLIRTVEGDQLGNFYDGKTEGLPGTFYTVVISPSGQVAKMLEPITTGACNSCHGKSTERIWVN